MLFELFMSLRYLKAKRKQTFISLITWISVGGIAVGVMALIVVISVMTGMQNELRDKILGTYSHIVVLNSFEAGIGEPEKVIETVRKNPHVVAAAPYVYGEMLASSESRSSGAVLRGVDPARESDVTDLRRYMKAGDLTAALTTQFADGEFTRNGVILGDALAVSLGVMEGDTISLISPKGRMTPMGMVPRIERFRVAGTFHSGMYQYDSGMVVISLAAAQEFMNMPDRVSGVEVKVDDIYAADVIARQLESALGLPYYARDWMEMNQNLFYALKLEKTAIFVILVLIVFVAAFNIVSTMIMVVMEKGRDIAILKSMGATCGMVMRIFFLEGFLIGFMGTVLGNILGYGLCVALKKYQFIKVPSDIYASKALTVVMDPMDFLIISACALAISAFSALYPAWNASRLDPAETLRYE